MALIQKIEKILTHAIDGVVTVFFTVILLLTIIQVCLRYGFNAALLGGNETMESLFIYTTALGAAVAVRRRQHINIDYFLNLLPGVLHKILEAIGLLLIAFLNGIMIYYSVPWIMKVGSNESPVMRIPEWTIQIAIPIGSSLVILYCLFGILLLFVTNHQLENEDRPC